MPPWPSRSPRSAVLLERVRVGLPVALGLAVVAVELGLGASRSLVAWAGRNGAGAAPALRPAFVDSTADWTSPSIALRPRDDLKRESHPFFLLTRSAAERRRAVRCLANAVYYEAALEPLDGQRAVAQVVLNRVRDIDFPRSICGVVYQGWERPTGCQFSFTCNGALSRPPVAALYAQARRVAEAALDGYVMAEVGTATHYHAAGVDPWWRPTLARIAQVGAHVFYGWTPRSQSGAFRFQRYGGEELKLPQGVIDGRVAQHDADAAAANTRSRAVEIEGDGAARHGRPALAAPDAPALKPIPDPAGQQL